MIPAGKPITSADELGLFITDILSNISQANGFETDVGTRVFRGKLKHDEDIVPYCTVIEGEDRPTDQGDENVAVRQQYAIGAYLTCDPDNPNDAAHAAIRDIKRALFTRGEAPGRRRMGNRVKNLTYLGKDIGPRADGRAIVFGVVHIEVLFVENLIAQPASPPDPEDPEEPEEPPIEP